MKKLLVPVFLIFLFSLLIAGCRAKEDIGQKIGEKIVEGIVGNENVDIDIDDDKITVKGKDGETLTLGGVKWPDIDYIPEFKKGEIISASNDGQGNVMILFEKVAQADFEGYREELKRDFPVEPMEMEAEEYLLYEGKSAGGETVVAQYFKEDNSFMIIGKSKSE